MDLELLAWVLLCILVEVLLYIGVLITMPIYALRCDLFVIVIGIVTVKLYASLLRF